MDTRNFQGVTGVMSGVRTSKDHRVLPGHGIEKVSTRPRMGRGSLGFFLVVRALHPRGVCMSLLGTRSVVVQASQVPPPL